MKIQIVRDNIVIYASIAVRKLEDNIITYKIFN